MSEQAQQSPVFSAERIAEILAVPPKPALVPTGEQRAVIEHELAGSTLVVAGAGSGKTETMANRVVWLVANGLVAPDAVLGLTFTRKAAGELRERITGRLEVFVERLGLAAERGELSEAELARASELRDLLGDGLETPEVSTYNAFASGVLQEFGIAAGVAPGAAVIDEATAWRIAREVLLASRDPELAANDTPLTTLIRRVIDLDHAVADNLTSFDRVDQIVREFSRVDRLPYDAKERDGVKQPSGKVYAAVRDAVAALAETPLVTRLARAYAEEKQRRGVIEFSDQLAFATRALEASPEAVAALRRRHRAILLDEVQDTSVGQTRFLSMIFAGSAVMAVGDPHQSIYGWRGASAEGLQSFHQDFRGRGRQRAPEVTLTLSTSWRNPSEVLRAANAVAAPLVADSAVPVPELAPRPGAGTGTVEWAYPETVHEERLTVAEWMRDARAQHLAEHGELPTAAVIFRTRSAMAAFSAALSDAGVPNRIVGLGGLLSTPEVTDLVSTLRCVWYADAGGELIRILSGPRFALGVADLAGLRSAARWFSERDVTMRPLSEEDREADSVLPDPDRRVTLIDALDRIAELRDLDHRALAGVSETGRERLREAGRMLAELRQHVGGGISDLISATVQALRLDIELDANEARSPAGGAAAHANLDRFGELVEGFLAIDTRGTLASLLEWIERATEDDAAAEHVPEPVPGTVQLITTHGSKGLEWDLVAIPRLVTGEFPGSSKSGTGWLRAGALPDELRGDASARPRLDWRLADTQKELRDRITEYTRELKDRHAEEERRLAYVAITRSAERLLLTGSFWGGQVKARTPSPFLGELAAAGVVAGVPEDSEFTEDPSEVEELTLRWPLDPLGARAERVLAAADRLRAAIADPGLLAGAEPDEVVRLLIAERRAQLGEPRGPAAAGSADARRNPALAERITASAFHEFVEDPVAAERRRLRPVPTRPFRRTRVGNRFHEWVERRSSTAAGRALPLVGLDAGEWDSDGAAFDAEAELQPLIENFEASRWAELQPIAVEQEVTLPFAGRTLVCKLDAVYRIPAESRAGADGGAAGAEDRYEVIDWKAGRPPRTEAERESRFFQLDLYRHAYAQWAGIDPERIDVSLFYVAEGEELRGGTPRSLAELERIWEQAAERVSDAAIRVSGASARATRRDRSAR
ncbi:ATP-dependent DNA helicase [Leucobacter luti]|uniref:ATP-dependent DNA helicase n=1 Tax=Leucobacter luti TaxID=340320 RepID=UPI003CFCBFDB